MCGIFAVLHCDGSPTQVRQVATRCANRLVYRGPDDSGTSTHVSSNKTSVLIHKRLAIVDTSLQGRQPMVHKGVAVIANGEIYNHKQLSAKYCGDYPFTSTSDCEVLLALYCVLGKEQFILILPELRGMFAFVLLDSRSDSALIVRDHMGMIPLYHGVGIDGCSTWVASELKAIADTCTTGSMFPPGFVMVTGGESILKRWYVPGWMSRWTPSTTPTTLRDALMVAVERHMMCDTKWGVLLSGGLDSSLITAMASRLTVKPLHTFSVGLESSPDLVVARRVSAYLGTIHHEYVYTVQEGADALEEVIRHLETYDITTCRASVPMYLLARWIKSLGFKMVLSGEGADEALGGYLYFHHAPNAAEFYVETRDKLQNLHLYDCLRANKSMAAWGVELRPPFLDVDVLEVAMGIPPEDKMILPGVDKHDMEKHVLRRQCEDLLPPDVLWRQKEQFSDGVGYNWISSLKEGAESAVSDATLQEAQLYLFNPPRSKEGFLYRSLFNLYFPEEWHAATVAATPSVACSTQRALQWLTGYEDNDDPSGLSVLGVHKGR